MPGTSNTTLNQHLEQARHTIATIDERIARLQHDRDVAAAKVEAFEFAVGVAETIELPVRHTLDAPPRSKPKRAPAGSWKSVFAHLVATGKREFNYNDVINAANALGITAEKTSARVRVSKFKDGGYLERVEEGVYKVTDVGERFFADAR